MGNKTTSSSSSSSSSSSPVSSMTALVSSNSSTFGGFSFFDFSWMTTSISDIMNHCDKRSGLMVWLGLQILILVMALLVNSALLWLLFKSRRHLSPSRLLAFNISLVDVLYCLHLPFSFYVTLSQTPEILHKLRTSLQTLQDFGCLLFLTLMCLERYVAAVFPITYLQFSKWNYRIILCVVAWVLILFVSILSFFFQSFSYILAQVVVIVLLFLVMLLCLAGIVCVLCQSRPGDGAASSDSLKKRALHNIIMVIVPSGMAYFPLVVLVGYLALIISKGTEEFTPEQCTVLQCLMGCPNVGLYIGPMFYQSHIRKMICYKKKVENTTSRTQAE